MSDTLAALEATPLGDTEPNDPMGPEGPWCVPVVSCVVHFTTWM